MIVKKLETYNDFYTRLEKSRASAKKVVRLTQLEPWVPAEYEHNGTRNSYYQRDVACFLQHPDVFFYRIVSIESKSRLNWVKSLIEATIDLPNVFFAYIEIGNIAASAPFPKMLSLQIIDDKEVFMDDPQLGYMPRSYFPCYYIKDKTLGKMYSDYYQKVWDTLRDNLAHGMLLKDGLGSQGYEQKLDNIKQAKGW